MQEERTTSLNSTVVTDDEAQGQRSKRLCQLTSRNVVWPTFHYLLSSLFCIEGDCILTHRVALYCDKKHAIGWDSV